MLARSQGFDRPADAAEDQFGRGFLVENAYKRLMAYDAAWSVRVALNGDWGSGKTSIAEAIAARALKEGHAVGWLYPWRVNTSKDVAIALTLTVLTALEKAGISLPHMSQAQKAVTGWIEFLKRFRGLHKAAEIGFSILEDASAFDANLATPIAQLLQKEKKRLLIIIDDLDRCEPNFLAPLLLFMRTVLDIPGFSFLAPFDSDVVSKALYASNTAWNSADRFLEKIFDFRITIPDLTLEQKTQFLLSQLAEIQLFVSDANVKACAAQLPGTPRAIKALVRDIGMVRLEIDRRSPEELNWPVLLLATMLRATSLEFFRAYLRDVVDTAVDQKAWKQRTEEKRTSDLDAIWEIVVHPDPATRRRVRQLVEELEREASSIGQLRRMLHFSDELEPVTRREFEEFFEHWHTFGLTPPFGQLPISESRPTPEVAALLAAHAIGGYLRTVEEISLTLADSLRDRRLTLVTTGRNYLAVATDLLALTGDAQGNQRFDLFVRLLTAERACNRAVPDVDDLHASALRLLEGLCAAAHRNWVRFDDCISATLPLDSTGDMLWQDVSATLRQPMKNHAREELLRRLQLTNGLDGIFQGHFGLMARIFLDPSDTFWDETNAPAVLAAGAAQAAIRENAGVAIHDILYFVWSDDGRHQAEVMRDSPAYFRAGLIARFLDSEQQLRTIWNAYAGGRGSDPDVEKTRAVLILLGSPAAALEVRSEH